LYHSLTINPYEVLVVFLSGGYSTIEACNRLGLNDDVGASFSRALSERLHYDLTDADFNAIMSSNIKLITEASA
jgi:fructose-bisphosphate aldolase, class I